jgi:hypothetical protein
LARSPVSFATAAAAARGRAPAASSSRSAVSAARRSADDEHDLPARRVAREALGELRGDAARDFLVQLRQLAADRHGALRVELGEQRQRRGQPPRRLERDERLRGRGEQLGQLAALARQKAREAPARGRQAGGDQRGDRRARAGKHLDGQALAQARLQQLVAGI